MKTDPNIKDNYGETPLYVASRNGHLDIVKCLVVECKADPNIKDNYGETPLYVASEKGYLKIVKYLVEECKADPNFAADIPRCLEIAKLKGNDELIKILTSN